MFPFLPYGTMPSGYAAPPAGVPFAQNPYTPFGSGFGLGLNFWNPGFGRGPDFPSNLWTPPTAEQSPQSPVPGAGNGAGQQNGNGLLSALAPHTKATIGGSPVVSSLAYNSVANAPSQPTGPGRYLMPNRIPTGGYFGGMK